ncbi:MAG: pilus assembly protein TadG-related protein [Leifsonia sp.]
MNRRDPQARARVRLADERGSTLPLVVFFMFLAIVVIVGVVGATSLYLERKRLLTIADGAALAGAEAFDLTAVRAMDDGLQASLTSEDVRSAALEYLASTGAGSLEGLAVESAASPDGRSADVRISAWWRPPVVSVLLPDGIRLEVESTARSVFH